MTRVYTGQTLTADRFLLDDPRFAAADELAQLLDATLITADRLTAELDTLLRAVIPATEESLLVYPGEGAQLLKGKLPSINHCETSDVYAKRWLTEDREPIAQVGSIENRSFIDARLRHIIVLDDVIASCATLAAVRTVNAWRFPRARFTAVAWVSNTLGSQRLKRLSGYDAVLSTRVLRHSVHQNVPINSLSTLCANRSVATSYVARHAPYRLQAECLRLLGHSEGALV